MHAVAASLVASIPSPSNGKLGPFNAYGLMIALAIITAIWLFGRRLEQAGVGTKDDASAIGVWGAVAGVIGSRLYHVATDWESFRDDLGRIFLIWKGGLGIPGGLLLGIPVGIWAARRRGLALGPTITAAAPAIPLAQAIGRWGNWFNQELFGRPTDLPWAVEIDAAKVPTEYAGRSTFHPTFLYESLGSLAIVGLLLWIEKRFRLKPGRLLAVFLMLYGVLRFFVEGLRIDPAKEGGGLRLNQWMAIIVFVGAAAFLLWSRTRPWPAAAKSPDDGSSADESDVDESDDDAVDDESGDDESADLELADEASDSTTDAGESVVGDLSDTDAAELPGDSGTEPTGSDSRDSG